MSTWIMYTVGIFTGAIVGHFEPTYWQCAGLGLVGGFFAIMVTE